MSVVNQTADKAMRELVTRRMRPGIAFSPADTAVLIVAPQPDLLGSDVSGLAQLLQLSRAAGFTVIYAPTTRPPVDATRRTKVQQSIIDAGLLRPGTAGTGIHPDLAAAPEDTILDPFVGLSAFTNPELQAALAQRNLDRVIIAGARTDIEVDSTARDALEAGLHATVVADCSIGSTSDSHKTAIVTTLPRLVHAVLTLADLPEFGFSSTGVNNA